MMSTTGKYLLSIGFLVAGVVGFIALSSLKRAPASAEREIQPPAVKTRPVQERNEGFWLEVDGEVSPYREVTISAEVAGKIEMKASQCFAGQYAKKGTFLLQINTLDYDLEVQRLEELTKQAKNSVEELDVEYQNTQALIKLAREELDLQRSELERITALYRQNVATDSDLDAARRIELASRNNMQAQQNQKSLLEKRRGGVVSEMRRIEAELRKARLDRERTEIRAPIDGIVTEDLVEAGAFVERGTPLVKLEDTSRVEVHFDLQYSQLQWLWQYMDKGQKPGDVTAGSSYELPRLPVTVVLTVEDKEFQWRGHLARYDGAGVNTVTRTVPCVAVVDERAPVKVAGDRTGDVAAPPALLRGMFVTVRIKIEPQKKLLGVPESAVRPGDEVWILRDGKLAIETIDVVIIVDEQALVIAAGTPIQAGDEIIVSPLPIAIVGMPLRKAVPTAAVSPSVSDSQRGS